MLPFHVVDERQAGRVSQDYTHIVVDSEARPRRADLEALLSGVDLMVIPTMPDVLSLGGLRKTLTALREAAPPDTASCSPLSRLGRHGMAMRRAPSCSQGVPMFDTAIPRLAAFSKAALAGIVVSEVKADPRAARGWEAYQRVGEELLL